MKENECDDVISSTETLFLGENVILRKMHEILHPSSWDFMISSGWAALHHTSIAQDHQLVKVTETLGIRLKNHNLIKLAHVRRFTPQEHHEAFVSSNYLS